MRAMRSSRRRRRRTTSSRTRDRPTTISVTASSSAARSATARARGCGARSRGMQIGWVYSYGTALPFNIVTGADNNNDTTVNDRPAGVGRNAGRMPCFADLTRACGTATFDMRLSRAFSLSATQPHRADARRVQPVQSRERGEREQHDRQRRDAVRDVSAGHGGRRHAPAAIGGSMEFLTGRVGRVGQVGRYGGGLAGGQVGLSVVLGLSRSSARCFRVRCSTPTQLAVPGRSNATPSITVGRRSRRDCVGRLHASRRDRRLRRGQRRRRSDVRRAGARQRRRWRRAAERRTAAARGRASAAGRHRGLDDEGCERHPLVQARSDNGGKSFGKTSSVPGGDAAGNRGWENAAADRNGRVYAVWLDHRELAQQDGAVAASHHDHAAMPNAKPDGVAMAQRSKLYFAIGSMARSRRARSPAASATAARRRSPRPPTAASSRRGATSIRATSATSPSPRRATAARPSVRRCASAKTNGCSKDAPTMGRRWRWMRRTVFTSSGRR